MALGGLAPVIIFTFFKSINTPSFLSGFITSAKIPLLPIPVYLDEETTGITLDDYNRTVSVENVIEGDINYERVSGDVVQMKFNAKKSNIAITALSALFDQVIKSVQKTDYSITVFYDNIFILNASLEQFQSSLVDGTDLREISITVSNRPPAIEATPSGVLARAGTAFGLN